MRAEIQQLFLWGGRNARNNTEHSIRKQSRVLAQMEELTLLRRGPEHQLRGRRDWAKGGGTHLVLPSLWRSPDLCADEKLFDTTLSSSILILLHKSAWPCFDLPQNSTLYLGMPLQFIFLLSFIYWLTNLWIKVWLGTKVTTFASWHVAIMSNHVNQECASSREVSLTEATLRTSLRKSHPPNGKSAPASHSAAASGDRGKYLGRKTSSPLESAIGISSKAKLYTSNGGKRCFWLKFVRLSILITMTGG